MSQKLGTYFLGLILLTSVSCKKGGEGILSQYWKKFPRQQPIIHQQYCMNMQLYSFALFRLRQDTKLQWLQEVWHIWHWRHMKLVHQEYLKTKV